ncbi:hypothetical protein C1H46_012575 [Malus baccata]|uniref:Uncharacterized protein n=1 Tax=Malus baccata TaxID=106549 RepID=A0A540MSJ5_MALBA|nr:hypothetical protein C1H46_012575 [Malus baccata]
MRSLIACATIASTKLMQDNHREPPYSSSSGITELCEVQLVWEKNLLLELYKVHNSLWLHHRDRIMQIVVHCSGADLKVESGVTTDLDRKSLLASDNSNGSIDNIVGSNSVSNANNVQKVKKDGDQVVGSNEGIGDKKSNPSKEIGVKESDNVAKSGEGSSEGSKLEGKDKKQKQSDGLE